jgi:hypothetical protein
MLSGFNTNIRHRGVVFHVQTEDSGRANPHVITHLFHGGNIMASEKRDYSDKLGGEDLETEVRALMEGLHKAMLKRLTRGEYDTGIQARLGAGAFGNPADSEADTVPPIPSVAPAALAVPIATEVAAPASPAPAESPKEQLARVFGDSVVSHKPLDEVVLDYLVENARKRKRGSR